MLHRAPAQLLPYKYDELTVNEATLGGRFSVVAQYPASRSCPVDNRRCTSSRGHGVDATCMLWVPSL
jgi:hypothetical protein